MQMQKPGNLMIRFFRSALLLGGTLLFLGCSTTTQSIIPPDLIHKIDSAITFSQIQASPASHQGTMILVGGQVLVAKRLKEYTRITILQLPLQDNQSPDTDLTKSQGRFIALQSAFLDPATIPAGTRVTLIGEVSGVATEPLDEMEYTYPLLTIKFLKVWTETNRPLCWVPGYGIPFYGPYGGAFGPYQGFYPYWYW